MNQPYGQQPGGNHPGSGGFQQPGGNYPDSGGMQQPGSGGFPQAPQAPGYQQGYGGMPAAPQEYSGGPMARPGVVTAAAVLAFVQAGITTITSILVWLGVQNLSGGDAALQAAVALAQTVGVVLLIMGGVQLMSGKSRTMIVIGSALEIVISLVWIVQVAVVDTEGIDMLQDIKTGIIAIALAFAIMPAISLVLSLGGAATQYVQSRRS
jgi:hypothetical protein